jgi:hypothetical protein
MGYARLKTDKHARAKIAGKRYRTYEIIRLLSSRYPEAAKFIKKQFNIK